MLQPWKENAKKQIQFTCDCFYNVIDLCKMMREQMGLNQDNKDNKDMAAIEQQGYLGLAKGYFFKTLQPCACLEENLDSAVEFLRQHLNLVVSQDRKYCFGCDQMKGDDAPGMLTCSACGVARFCSIEHRKRSWTRNHKAICPLLKRWKLVVRGVESSDACKDNRKAFLFADDQERLLE